MADPDAVIREQLLAISKLPSNSECADCGDKDNQWASANLGVFLCITCAGIHRKLGVHVSRVKSTELDRWKAEEVAVMQGMGNRRANDIYEGNMGLHEPIRTASDTAVSIKEQWIRAKYVRKIYKKPEDGPNLKVELPAREGFMTKKGEVVKNWKRRWFILSGSMLAYYKKQSEATPAGIINVLEATHTPECLVEPPLNQPYCFSIPTSTREYLINADTPEDMYDWIQAIRSARRLLSNPSKFGFRTKAGEITTTKIEQLTTEIGAFARSNKRKVNGKVISNCIHGNQVVDYLIVNLTLETRADAVTVGQQLLEKGIIRPTTPGEAFSDSASVYTTSV